MTLLAFVVLAMSLLLPTGTRPAAATAQDAAGTKPVPPANRASPPSCLECPLAEFPSKARKAKVSSATVQLEVTVSIEGRAAGIKVVSDPGNGFAENAVKAVKRWKFKPAIASDGRKIPVIIRVDVTFRSVGKVK